MDEKWRDGTKVKFRPSFAYNRAGYDGVFTISGYSPDLQNVLVEGIGRTYVGHLIVVKHPKDQPIKRSDVQKYLDQGVDLPLDKSVDLLRHFGVDVEEDQIVVEVGHFIEWEERFAIPSLPVNTVLRSSDSVVYDRWLEGWYVAGPERELMPTESDFTVLEGEFPFIVLYLPEVID